MLLFITVVRCCGEIFLPLGPTVLWLLIVDVSLLRLGCEVSILGVAVLSVADFRTVPPGRVSIRFVSVVVDLPPRMKLCGLEGERVSVILVVRLADDLPEVPVGFRRVVMDRLLGAIGRVIRIVLGELIALFDRVVDDFGVGVSIVDFLVVAAEGRRAGAEVATLPERIVDCLDVVGAERLFTMTGRVTCFVFDELMVLFELALGRLDGLECVRLLTMTGLVILFVFDELMVLFELTLGGLDVLGVERLLTMTGPGLVLGPT